MNMQQAKDAVLQYSSWQVIRDIWVLLRPYRAKFIFASIVRLIGDLVWLYPAIAFASIVTFLTRYTPGQSLSRLWWILGLWIGVTVIYSLSQFVSKYSGYRLAEAIRTDSILQGVRHLFRLDIAWHERENSGNKIKRITTGSEGYLKDILRCCVFGSMPSSQFV